MAKPEVLIIGIDGATFGLIDPWVELGCLPNIAEVLHRGVRGMLRSTLTANTCPAWKSFSTGKNPGKLGVFNWRNKIYGSYEAKLVEPAEVGGRDLWDLLSAAGRRVAVVGVPMTYPPRPVNGVMLTGMLTPPGASFAYPREIGTQIEQNIGRYIRDPAVVTRPTENELFEQQDKITLNRLDILRYLLDPHTSPERDGYDFVMVVFTATDRLQHLFWPRTDTPQLEGAVLRAYRQIDRAIGEIRQLASSDTTVILMSDHGFSHVRRSIHVNQLFSDMGLLVAENQGKSLLQRLGITRQTAGRLARRMGLGRLRARLPEAAKRVVPMGRFGFDMSRTRAFSWSAGEVFINLRGREPKGVVEPGREYEALRDLIIDRLENLRDGGRKLKVRAFRREEVFRGEYVAHAPDLMIDVGEPGYGLGNPYAGSQVSEILPGTVFTDSPGRAARHDADGIFAAAGPHIFEGTEIRGAQILDIAPTVLHAMGLPVPEDMDGRVLSVFAADSPPAGRPVGRCPAEPEDTQKVPMTQEEQERLREVLRGFGYLG